jgi:Ca-activated chloride channel homolog
MRGLRFAASVAALGQLLRESERLRGFSYDESLAVAEPAIGDDLFGYPAEFLKLVRNAKGAARRQGECRVNACAQA